MPPLPRKKFFDYHPWDGIHKTYNHNHGPLKGKAPIDVTSSVNFTLEGLDPLNTNSFQITEAIMFILSRLKSLVRLEPKEFNRPLPEALADVLNAKLANKIVQGNVVKYL